MLKLWYIIAKYNSLGTSCLISNCLHISAEMNDGSIQLYYPYHHMSNNKRILGVARHNLSQLVSLQSRNMTPHTREFVLPNFLNWYLKLLSKCCLILTYFLFAFIETVKLILIFNRIPWLIFYFFKNTFVNKCFTREIWPKDTFVTSEPRRF